jgi:hypothetical protein
MQPGSEGCENISDMLKSNATLKKLVLSSNIIDTDAVKALADGLGVNKSLTTLVGGFYPFFFFLAHFFLSVAAGWQSFW